MISSESLTQPDVMEDADKATFDVLLGEKGQTRMILRGRLDRDTIASIWRQSTHALRQVRLPRLIVEAGDVVY